MALKAIFTFLLVLSLWTTTFVLSSDESTDGVEYYAVAPYTNPLQDMESHAGRLHIAIFNKPATLNPVENTDDTSWKILDRIYDTLVVLDKDLNPIPWLAESWTVESLTEYVVKLKHGIKWHDGTELTSADIVFTYEKLKDNKRFEYAISPISTVTEVDNLTVKFTLSTPFSPFLNDTLRIPILPKHKWASATDETLVGCGPFKYSGLQEQQVNFVNETVLNVIEEGTKTAALKFAHIAYPNVNTLENWTLYQIYNKTYTVLIENENYTLYSNNGTIIFLIPPPRGATIFANYSVKVSYIKLDVNSDYFMTVPKLDGINFYFYPTPKGAVQMFTNGDVNIDYIMENVPGESVPKGISKYELLDYGFYYMGFNMENQILHDIILRKALTMCVDKKTLITTYSPLVASIGGSRDYIGAAVVSPANKYWYNETVPNEYVYVYDVDGVGGITDKDKTYCLSVVNDMLSAAGYRYGAEGARLLPDGRKFNLTALLPSPGIFPTEDAVVSEVVDNMRYVGININEYVYESIEERDAKLAAREFDIFFKKYTPPTLDPYYLYDLFYSTSSNNIMKYASQEFDNLIVSANQASDVLSRKNMVQHAQGIIATDLPLSVIFYTNIVELCNKDRYEGWVERYGGIGNKMSFLNVYITDEYKLTVEIDAPDTLAGGIDSAITIKVMYGGEPIENAVVNLSTEQEAFAFTPSTGTTDINGSFKSIIKVPAVSAQLTLNATLTVAKPNYAVYKKTLQFTINPPKFNVELKSSKKCINSTEKVIVTVYVNYYGTPVSDATVNLTSDFDATITPLVNTTNKDGYAEFEFTADVDVYTVFTITATVEKSGYLTSASTITIGVEPRYEGIGFEFLLVLTAVAVAVFIRKIKKLK